MAYEDYFTGSQFDFAKSEQDIKRSQKDLISQIEGSDPRASMFGFGAEKPTLDKLYGQDAFMDDLVSRYEKDYGVFGTSEGKYGGGLPTSAKDFYKMVEIYAAEGDRGYNRYEVGDYIYDLAGSMGIGSDEIDNIFSGYAGQNLGMAIHSDTVHDDSWVVTGGEENALHQMHDIGWNDLSTAGKSAYEDLYNLMYGGDDKHRAQRAFQTTMFNEPLLGLEDPYAGITTVPDEGYATRGSQIAGLGQTYEGEVGKVRQMGSEFGQAARGRALGFGATGLAGSGSYLSDMTLGGRLYGQGIEGARGARSQSWADIGQQALGFAGEDMEAVTGHYDATTGAYDDWLTTLSGIGAT